MSLKITRMRVRSWSKTGLRPSDRAFYTSEHTRSHDDEDWAFEKLSSSPTNCLLCHEPATHAVTRKAESLEIFPTCGAHFEKAIEKRDQTPVPESPLNDGRCNECGRRAKIECLRCGRKKFCSVSCRELTMYKHAKNECKLCVK